jgi:RNA polymerase sigma-70 factor, ECF subfamily
MNIDTTTEQIFLKAHEAHSDAIFRYCFFQVSNREQALDLTQDTFIKTWEYMVKGQKIDNMKAFLYRIATNAIIDYRRKKKTNSLDSMIEDGYDIGHDERENHEQSSDGELIMKSLANVEEKYREVLSMRYIEDMSIREIAIATGESENNVSVRIHRGIEKLKNNFESRIH